MVMHIFFWIMKDNSIRDEAAALLQEKFKALLGVVEGLEEIEAGAPADADYDLVLYSAFRDWEALEGYQQHPAHIAIKEIIHALVCDRCCCDYEV